MSRMPKRFTVSDALRYRRKHQIANQRLINNSIDQITKAIKHKSSIKLVYSQYPAAFEYVSKKFPDVPIKSVEIYRCDASYLNEIGLGGIGGCYSCFMQVIVISHEYEHQSVSDDIWGSVRATATIDEIIVHELLHYVSLHTGARASSMEVEEEFAYSNSIEYLRQKGYSDDDIVEKNFLPYFMTIVDTKQIVLDVFGEHGYFMDDLLKLSKDKLLKLTKKYDEEVFHLVKKAAIEKAKELIELNDNHDKEYYDEINDFSGISFDL